MSTTTEALAATSDELLHYYAFSFVDGSGTGSIYIGFTDNKVTVPRIESAKRDAGMNDDAALIGLGYMGFMTHAEATGLK